MDTREWDGRITTIMRRGIRIVERRLLGMHLDDDKEAGDFRRTEPAMIRRRVRRRETIDPRR